MLNEQNYVVSLNRLEVCDLLLSTLHIVHAAEDEMRNDPECDEYRRNHVLPGTIKKWRTLHDKIKKQLEILDALNLTED